MGLLFQSRHPELVSGSRISLASSNRGQAQPDRQINPMRISLLNKVELPRSVPAFQLLFAADRAYHVAKLFEVDQPVDCVFRGEPWQHVVTMLPKPRDQVRGDANVKGAARVAGQDIGARIAFNLQGLGRAAKGTLKQVQDDNLDHKNNKLNSARLPNDR